MQRFTEIPSIAPPMLTTVLVLLSACARTPESPASPEPSSSSDGWETVQTEDKPTGRHENAFTSINGHLYLLGGRGDRPVERYNPGTNSWKQVADMPKEMHHFQARAHNGKIWVIGALTGNYPDEDPVPKIYTFDPSSNEWSVEAPIPEDRRRGAAGVALHDGVFYIVGGIQNGHVDGYVAWLDRYNPETGEWTRLPDAPHKRDHFQAGIVNGQLIAAGGRRTSADTGEVFQLTVPHTDVYDLESGEWTTAEANIPTKRAGTAATVYDGKLLVAGGESKKQRNAHDEVEAFDPTTMEWTTWPSLNRGRHGTQLTVLNGRIHVAAGSGNRGGGPELTSLERFEK